MHTSLRETLETEVQTHVEDYGDLLVQNIETDLRIPAANLPDTLPVDTEVTSYDVMGDVDRYGADEAVLLAQKLRSLTVALQGTYTNEANVIFRYAFGFDTELDVTLRPNVDEGFGTQADVFEVNEIDNDILYHCNGKATAGFEDTGVGTGAGPESHKAIDETNYLTEVGVLPEVSARENLNEYLYVNSPYSQAPDDGTFRLYSSWQLFFLETDDEIEGRQLDVLD